MINTVERFSPSQLVLSIVRGKTVSLGQFTRIIRMLINVIVKPLGSIAFANFGQVTIVEKNSFREFAPNLVWISDANPSANDMPSPLEIPPFRYWPSCRQLD
jgi:hypothetical protein